MIKDMLVSFADNIKTKSTNPFFGTLILVWLTKNWILVYSLFNFDLGVTLTQKKDFIINHFSTQPLIETLFWCVIETFILIIISYFLVNLSRLIINFYEKRVTPLIYKWTDEKSIVLKSVYDISEKERQRLEKRLDEERESKLKLQEDYDKLEKRISELLTQLNNKHQNDKNDNLSKSTKKSRNEILEDDRINMIIDKLIESNKIDSFEKIASTILNENPLSKSSKLVQEFTTIGLISVKDYHSSPEWYLYNLTPIGKEIHDRILFKKIK